jgi:hypothetical protein
VGPNLTAIMMETGLSRLPRCSCVHHRLKSGLWLYAPPLALLLSAVSYSVLVAYQVTVVCHIPDYFARGHSAAVALLRCIHQARRVLVAWYASACGVSVFPTSYWLPTRGLNLL